jgi:hypothetical protein
MSELTNDTIGAQFEAMSRHEAWVRESNTTLAAVTEDLQRLLWQVQTPSSTPLTGRGDTDEAVTVCLARFATAAGDIHDRFDDLAAKVNACMKDIRDERQQVRLVAQACRARF